ncbi:MAG: 5'-nucleotidase C-terminal domain-containing protein [Oscillospiraceae bacterium]|jgi:hypothetical protein
MKKRVAVKIMMYLVLLALLYALLGKSAPEGSLQSGDALGMPPMRYSRVEAGSRECGIGLLAADAVRNATGADIAIVNSGDIQNTLNPGHATWDDIFRVFAQDREISVTELTPHELSRMLEVAVSHVTVDPETEMIDRAASAFDGFAQISGFVFKYDGPAGAGGRVYSIAMEDGTTLDPNDMETRIILAATKYMLEGGYGYPAAQDYADTGITLAQALAGYTAGSVAVPEGGRIIALGVHENRIVNLFPKPLLYICLGFLVAIAVVSKIGWNIVSFNIYVPQIKKEW